VDGNFLLNNGNFNVKIQENFVRFSGSIFLKNVIFANVACIAITKFLLPELN
jgi:hypothetical protein